MVTVQDLSASNVFQIQPSEFQLQKFLDTPSSWTITGYNIANDGVYHLWFIGRQVFELQDGTQIQNGRGFLITKDVEGQNWQIAIQSIPVSGAYGSISENTLQEVVTDYNSTIGGEESTEDISEQVARESAQEREEERQAQDNSEAENYDPPYRVTDEVVYDKKLQTVMPNPYEGQITNKYYLVRRYVVIKTGRGKTSNPIIEYFAVRITTRRDDRKNLILSSGKFDTDLIAWDDPENPYDNLEDAIQSIEANFQELQENKEIIEDYNERYKSSFEAQYERKNEETVELYYKKSDLSFKQMLLSDDLDYSEFAFRKGVEGDTRVGGGLGVGGFGDAVSWSNGNNTLNLKDFDTPRITAEGISENQSGSVSFTVKLGWKVKFSIDSDNDIIFENKDEIDNQVVNNKIEFVMYGGDRLEIDIDNEREGVYPFLVTSAGKEWSSQTELDDELSLTMISAEQLYFRYEEKEVDYYVNRPDKPIKDENITFELEGRVSFSTPPLSDNPVVASKVREALVENQEYQETMTYTRDIVVTDIPVERSFISPDDIVEDITPDIENPISKYRWWIIGGIIGLVAVGGLYVFINARARGGN
jgi:hypothetical protein